MYKNFSSYLKVILQISEKNLKKTFSKGRYNEFLESVYSLDILESRDEIIKRFSEIYINFVKEDYQRQYQGVNEELTNFIGQSDDSIKIIWGDCLDVLKGMKSE